jgi:hypothetical protein
MTIFSGHAVARAVPRAVIVATIAAAAAACGHDATGPTSPVGSYALSSVNGLALPATVLSDTGFSVAISEGSLSVQADGRFVVGVTSTWTIEGHPSVFAAADTGTWTQAGGRLVFTYVDSTTQTGSWQGDRITLSDSSGRSATTFVYARR